MAFFVESEIESQPDCWLRAADLVPSVVDAFPAAGERVAIVGCGTSWFVAQVLASWRESAGGGETDAFAASEMPDRPYDHVIALTRSGTTTEVIDLLQQIRGRTTSTVVTADLQTPVVELADHAVDLSFADEQSVVQTRFATTTMALFRAWLGADLEPLVAVARSALAGNNPDLRAEIEALAGAEQVSFLGRGWAIGIAHEAALKFRETSSSWAESYPAMDYRHGPISIAAPRRLVWMFGAAPTGLAEDVAPTGARFVDHALDPMVDLVVAQQVAIARAYRLGVDPDHPRHLSRSVVLSQS